MTLQQLKDYINNNIVINGVRKITAPIINTVLNTITEIFATIDYVDDKVSESHTQNTDTYLDKEGTNEVTAANAKDAVDKKHSQNTDTYLDKEGTNEVTAANAKDAVDKKHSQNTDTYLDKEGTNEVTAANAKDAVDKKHSQNTDTQISNTGSKVETKDNAIVELTGLLKFLTDLLTSSSNDFLLTYETDGSVKKVETVVSSLTFSSFNVSPYSGYLDLEANWINNWTNIIASTGSELLYGVFDSGTIGCIFSTQNGWGRFLSNNLLEATASATLIAQLVSTGNWTKVSDGLYISNAGITSGDLNQEYYTNGNLYKCIAGHAGHTWLRFGTLDTITTTDILYLPKPQIEVGKVTTNTFVIAGTFDITSIIAKAVTGGVCDISIGSAPGLSDIVAVTAMPTVPGTRKQLIYLVDVNYPTSSDRTLHITLTNGLDVTLEILTQKLFT